MTGVDNFGRTPSRPYIRRGHSTTKGLRGAWPHFAGSGTVLRDISGHRRPGAFTNMDSSDWVHTPLGWAISHTDGQGGEYIDFGYSSQTIPISVVMWANPDFDGNDFTTAWGNRITSTSDDLYMGTDSNSSAWLFAHDAASIAESGGTVESGTWKCIGMTIDGSRLRAYEDGVEVVNVADSTTTAVDNTNNFNLGAADSGSNAFNGDTAHLYVWDRGLSAGDFAHLYENPLSPIITKPR